MVLLIAEKLCKDYMEFARNREFDWDEYNAIDPKVYAYFCGGARKLTEEEEEYEY